MDNNKGFQWILIALLTLAIVVMSVGFATYTSTLTVNGNVTAKGNPWSVHFDKDSYSATGSNVTVTPTIGNTSISYAVTLEKPGDKYTFTINVVNDGTIDANLKAITLGAPTTAQDEYINYTVKYAGTTYTASNNSLNVALANTTGVAALEVTVEYDPAVAQEKLPTEDVTMNLSVALDYTD